MPSGGWHQSSFGTGLSKFLTLLNAVANQSRPYQSGSVQHPHDKDVIVISLHDTAILLRGYPNRLPKFSEQIPHWVTLRKKKLNPAVRYAIMFAITLVQIRF